eukprot:Ihof_evm3s78 gene=Ihof_evmTU3s78
MLKSYNMKSVKSIMTLILQNYASDLEKVNDATPGCIMKDYQKAVGRLLWITRFMRPDMVFAVSYLG